MQYNQIYYENVLIEAKAEISRYLELTALHDVTDIEQDWFDHKTQTTEQEIIVSKIANLFKTAWYETLGKVKSVSAKSKAFLPESSLKETPKTIISETMAIEDKAERVEGSPQQLASKLRGLKAASFATSLKLLSRSQQKSKVKRLGIEEHVKSIKKVRRDHTENTVLASTSMIHKILNRVMVVSL